MQTNTYHQDGTLNIDRCPHCNVAAPLLSAIHSFVTTNSRGGFKRQWRVYSCSRCGGAVLGSAGPGNTLITEIYPRPQVLDEGIPVKAAAFLKQAIECVHAPSGAIMLCASSVDAMLKDKGLKDGSLNSRIEQAARDGFITREMAQWAHEVRLDANGERHADEKSDLPSEPDARRCIEFSKALALFMFVLPSMVERGRKDANPIGTQSNEPATVAPSRG
ncbi:MAG: DUF4145 domain-containing protein [Verrucomicrobiia bacterium]